MAKSPIIIGLEDLYSSMGNKWVNQNSLILNFARNCNLAVGGSIAMAISNRKPHKIPGDFDFFTDNNENALNFLNKLILWLAKRPNTNYKLLVNTKNKYTLPGVSHHIRLLVPFWKPICVMTLESPIRTFCFKGGLKVQYFDDVVSAAKHVSCIDNKNRLPFDVEESRRNIRERYIADGTYDVEEDIPVTGSIRRGQVNILYGPIEDEQTEIMSSPVVRNNDILAELFEDEEEDDISILFPTTNFIRPSTRFATTNATCESHACYS